MELKVLIDNNTLIDRYFLGEPGLSFLIQAEGKKILFDLGYSDCFIHNARKMQESLLDLDAVVLSHGHMDHTWGLPHLMAHLSEAANEKIPHKRPVLIGHPQVLESKLYNGTEEIGSIISPEKAAHHFLLQWTKEPYWITEKLVFLGEIPRVHDFENQTPIGEVACGPDYLFDDSALAYMSEEGLAILSGCAHAGICNIIRHAQQVCGEDRIADLVGGLHLLAPKKDQLEGTLETLKKIGPAQLHPCHCTDLDSKFALTAVAPVLEVGVGTVLKY
jgi:7,8-dihydropterin-6-yl-methyl-4-(beta-D-ribofuranosyl)aminobenzene 5'-phosphate synthase